MYSNKFQLVLTDPHIMSLLENKYFYYDTMITAQS